MLLSGSGLSRCSLRVIEDMMFNNKRGVELSMNVIIIAALVLIVLVVLVLIFGYRMNIFGTTLNTCNGVCQPTSTCLTGSAAVPMNCDSNGDGKADGKYCCTVVWATN